MRLNNQYRKNSSRGMHVLVIIALLLVCLSTGNGQTGVEAKPAQTLPTWFFNAIWHQLDRGVSGSVLSIVKSGTDYYVGGSFTDAGGIEDADYLARWDGNAWHAVGTGISAAVNVIVVDGTKIYVGGNFDNINSNNNMSRIAYWDTLTGNWNVMDGGLNDSVMDMVLVDGDLYVGGSFTDATGDGTANRIVRWNGDTSSWESIGGDLDNTVQGLAAYDGQLFVGGNFLDNGSGYGHRVRKYTISSGVWSGLYTSLSDLGVIYDMSMCSSTVYAAGVTGVYYFDISLATPEWVGLTSPGATVKVVDCLDGEVYAGGYFTDASSDDNADYLARYYGSSWDAVGAGFSGVVEALLVESDGITAGGGFYYNNGSSRPLNGIARWSLSRWDKPSGEASFTDNVNAVAVVGEEIFVGGDFTEVGGSNGDYLVRWDGKNWVEVGDTPLSGPVLSLEPYGSGVVIGGDFTNADGDSTDDYNITYFDGTSFNPLGMGLGDDVSGIVYDILVNGTDIYATGVFENEGSGAPALHGIARWDGD
ncbi:MAG: hypothetical protein JXR32_02575, partial [Anaerolineaceae bacterium]|nr:hypothetical protein [Anaerolineaceae bacterium]